MSNADFEIADLKFEPDKAKSKTQQFIFVLAEDKTNADAIASDHGFGECNELVNGKPPQFSRTWKEMAGAPFRNLGNYVFGGAAKPVVKAQIIATVAGQLTGDLTLTDDEHIKRAKEAAEAAGSAGQVPIQVTGTGQSQLAPDVIPEQPNYSAGPAEDEGPSSDAVGDSGSGTRHAAIKKKRSNNTTDPAEIQVLTGVRWDPTNEPTEATAKLPIEYTVIEATRADQYAIIIQTMEMTHMVGLLNAQFVSIGQTNASQAAAQPYLELVRNSYGNKVPPITIDGSSSTSDMVYTTRTGNAVIFPGPDQRDWRNKMNRTTVYAGKPKKNMLARVVGYTDALVRDTTRRFVCRAKLSPAESDRHRLLLFCTLVYTGWGKYQRAATVEDRGNGVSGSLTCTVGGTVGGTVGEEDDSEPDGTQFTSGTVFHFKLERDKQKRTTFDYEIIDAHAATQVAMAQAPGAAVSLPVARPAHAPAS
jgi:hypothetical protein